MNKTVLVTGCAGFIGSNMCKHLLKKKYFVIGIDNFLTGIKENLSTILNNPNFRLIEHDICNKININSKIDYILHFASTASPTDYLKYPIMTLKIGSLGTENVLELGLRHGSTVLVASTSEIYGDPLEHPQKESYFGNVNPIGPRGVYDEAKRYLEALTMAYHVKKKLNTKIVRIFNTYGPNMRITDGRAIPNFINQILKNNKITIYGNGEQTRSFCYIDDTINGIFKALLSNYNLPINIGNTDEFSINQLVKIISNIIPNHCEISYKELPENDPKIRRPDISLAKKILNWEPEVDINSGLIKTIKYFKCLEK